MEVHYIKPASRGHFGDRIRATKKEFFQDHSLVVMMMMMMI